MTDVERARLGAEFQRIIEAGLQEHLSNIEKDLVSRLLKAWRPAHQRELRARIRALRAVGGYIAQTIADGKLASEKLKDHKEIEDGKRRPFF